MKKVVRTFRISLRKWMHLERLATELGVSRGHLIRGAIGLLLESRDFAKLPKEVIV